MISTEHVWGIDDGLERELLAVIVRGSPQTPSTHFVTDPSLPQQVAVMLRARGEEIKSHRHLPKARGICLNTEVLMIRGGEVKVGIYDVLGGIVTEKILRGGDILIQIAGGHSFYFNEDTEIVEVKVGPYDNTKDKVYFKQ